MTSCGTSDADVLVVGAGMSGLAVAAEIGRRGRQQTVVLEAGPDCGPLHMGARNSRANMTSLWLRPEMDPNFHRPWTTVGGAYAGLAGLRQLVGGRSLYWGGVMLPIEEWALARDWPAAIVSELTESWDGGRGLYQRVVDDVEAWGAEPRNGPRLDLGDWSFARTPHAIRAEPGGGWSAFSPLAWWHSDTGDRRVRRIPIWSGYTVVAVLIERGRLIGVRVRSDGGERDLRAGRVVLAAGTVENSRLALQSLYGPGQPSVLTGLVDKIAQGFVAALPDGAQMSPEVVSAARERRAFHRTAGADRRSNHFVRFVWHPSGTVTVDSWMMGEQKRATSSHVSCSPREWPWTARVEAALDPADMRLRARQQVELTEFWKDLADTFRIPAAPLEFEPVHGSPDLAERLFPQGPTPVTYSFPLGAEQHEAGTLTLGGLLDDDHQFRDVPGLYVAGPSSFPRTGAANPSMTTLALSRRLGAVLSGRRPPQDKDT